MQCLCVSCRNPQALRMSKRTPLGTVRFGDRAWRKNLCLKRVQRVHQGCQHFISRPSSLVSFLLLNHHHCHHSPRQHSQSPTSHPPPQHPPPSPTASSQTSAPTPPETPATPHTLDHHHPRKMKRRKKDAHAPRQSRRKQRSRQTHCLHFSTGFLCFQSIRYPCLFERSCFDFLLFSFLFFVVTGFC